MVVGAERRQRQQQLVVVLGLAVSAVIMLVMTIYMRQKWLL